ncbi:MAG: hypothetical protein ACEQSA_04665 [Weeksellaceae bacterium]
MSIIIGLIWYNRYTLTTSIEVVDEAYPRFFCFLDLSMPQPGILLYSIRLKEKLMRFNVHTWVSIFAMLVGAVIPVSAWALLGSPPIPNDLDIQDAILFLAPFAIVFGGGLIGLLYSLGVFTPNKNPQRKEETMPKNNRNELALATPARLRVMIFLLAISVLMLIASVGVVATTGQTSWCGGIVFGLLFTMITGRQVYRIGREIRVRR